MGAKKINITIDEDLLSKFRKYCKENGMKISTRLQYLVKKDLKLTNK